MNDLLFIVLIASVLLNSILLTLAGYKLYRRYYVRTYGNRNFRRAEIFEKMPLNKSLTIFLGDSHTDHFEVSELFNDATLINRGISGNTSSDVLERLSEITGRAPSKVFIMIGVNDFTHGLEVEEIVTNYRQIIQRIRKESPHTTIYCQSILPYRLRDKNIQKTNTQLAELCSKEQVLYIDLYPAFEENGALHKKYDCGDGLHLNGEGYLRWRDLIGVYVRQV